MSSREPLWYCHECNAEMRPLMVPDPVCASCRGSFVEKMEDPGNDPREFQRGGGMDVGGVDGEIPLGLEAFLYALQSAATRGAPHRHSTTTQRGSTRTTRTFEVRSGPGGTSRTMRVYPDSIEDPDQPTMADFLQRSPSEDGPGGITGSLMARYLMALLGRDSVANMFGAQPGRMGDYVFNQEALDEIITQLMENSNTSRPVPATDEIVEKLPREVLEEGSPMLEKDCAVCKDPFKLETEDPDEQVVVTLPCKHPFHEPCILPWLKSSGTCPVCRYALIPQPEHHGPPAPGSSNGGGSGGPSHDQGSPPPANGGPGSSLMRTLLGNYAGSANGSGPGQSRPGDNRRRSSSDAGPSGQRSNRHHVPGGWEELD